MAAVGMPRCRGSRFATDSSDRCDDAAVQETASQLPDDAALAICPDSVDQHSSVLRQPRHLARVSFKHLVCVCERGTS